MEVVKSKCNTCKVETERGQEPAGWIQLHTLGGSYFSLFMTIRVRTENQEPPKHNCVTEKQFDFCSPECLAIYVQKMAHKPPKGKQRKGKKPK